MFGVECDITQRHIQVVTVKNKKKKILVENKIINKFL